MERYEKDGLQSIDAGAETVTLWGLNSINPTLTRKSVVQLYVQSPYKQGGLEKMAVQPAAFGKIGVLEPGASEDLTIEFDPLYFASYDENAVKADGIAGAWTLEDGDYYFAIGNGAHEALNNILAKKTGSSDNLVMTADTEAIDRITPSHGTWRRPTSRPTPRACRISCRIWTSTS